MGVFKKKEVVGSKSDVLSTKEGGSVDAPNFSYGDFNVFEMNLLDLETGQLKVLNELLVEVKKSNVYLDGVVKLLDGMK